MRLPIVPLIVTATILTAAVYLFNTTGTTRLTLDVPRITRLVDIDGTETEVSIAPDGNRYAVVANGDLWVINMTDGFRHRITQTTEPETFPAWMSDGRGLTFTRGTDTFVYREGTSTEVFKANATSMSWSPTGRAVFVRDRSLWLTDQFGQNERQIVEADVNPDIILTSPRFSPDSIQVAFIKSQFDLRGEVWTVDLPTGQSSALVVDRPAENPLDVGWIQDGKGLVYLTNRAGTYSLWRIDLVESTILPLTQPLILLPLSRIGIGVWKDRIVLPRHFLNSNIILSDGTPVIHTGNIEFQPAISPDGTLLAYTRQNDSNFEVWTASITGEDPRFRALGREPRFSPNGFELVYTHTDLAGNDDLWKLDLRDDASEKLTDAYEIDVTPDWSPDGRTIVFSSARGGTLSLWTVGTTGGKRLRINDGGYAPRYSHDGRSILYWNKDALWSIDDAGGTAPRLLRDHVAGPVKAVWITDRPAIYADSPIQPIWPSFDVMPDGRWLVAPIEVQETALWAVDLTYKEE